MTEENKSSLIWTIVIIIAICGFFGYSYYVDKAEDTEQKIKEEKEIESEAKDRIAINGLVEKYNAIINWDKDQEYTVQVQNILVDQEQPVLFWGYIEDIFKKEDRYFIKLNQYTSDIIFILECSKEESEKFIRLEEGDDELFYNEYAVIAKIEDVQKPVLQIYGEYSSYYEDIEIKNDSVDTFIATGVLIDSLPIESLIFDLDNITTSDKE